MCRLIPDPKLTVLLRQTDGTAYRTRNTLMQWKQSVDWFQYTINQHSTPFFWVQLIVKLPAGAEHQTPANKGEVARRARSPTTPIKSGGVEFTQQRRVNLKYFVNTQPPPPPPPTRHVFL
ncbi:hypothetical protein EVAR_33046_1 [Eumeta japonica]|uniref:Uncharacterized protein n=1 Tax=Eumeta variegata TaxID=151549 RepID=A0A4C1WWT3_EUMVA|nr:hypothetical protein EVAR_33046_1 [Eumeta japonica]